MKLRFARLMKDSVAVATAATLVACIGGGTTTAQTPVAHWTFDQGINNYDLTEAVDIVNANNGTWQDTDTNGLAYVAGQIGGAVRMGGGNNEYFLVPSIPQIDGIAPTPEFPNEPVLGVGVTWMGWFQIGPNAPTESTYKGILMTRTAMDVTTGGISGADQNFGLAWQDAGGTQGDHLDTRISGAAVDSPNMSVQPGIWYHAALVWGNTESSGLDPTAPGHVAYLNGVPVGSNANTGVFELISSGSWLLGEDTCCGGREWSGMLDDLAIFDSALTDAQVLQKYNNGLAGIDASGNNTGKLAEGDVDGGGLSIADFNIIRDNLGKTANARNLGDLNGDRRVDLNDFRQWLDAAPAPLVSAALSGFSTTVPEPSTVVLVGFTLLSGAAWSRRFARS